MSWSVQSNLPKVLHRVRGCFRNTPGKFLVSSFFLLAQPFLVAHVQGALVFPAPIGQIFQRLIRMQLMTVGLRKKGVGLECTSSD